MAVSNRLRHHVAEMVALEAGTGETLQRLANEAGVHSEVAALLQGFRELSLSQQQSLQGRLNSIAPGTYATHASPARTASNATRYPVSAALRTASAVLNHAITGYAMLRTIALRNRDSILAGKDNTGDMAEQHAKNYAGAVHKINQVLHNVVVWEMNQDGETCKCTCPSCGLGICLCAQAPRRTLSDTWVELGPISTDTSVTVQEPRPDSLAASAGLLAGDVIVAADGQKLESHFMLQGVITEHQSGEVIELSVRRMSGEVESVELVCP